MYTKSVLTVVALSSVIVVGSDNVGARTMSSAPPDATLFVSGMASGSGSAIGPGGDLYVTEAVTGRVLRVDPKTGDVSTFASGLPIRIVGTGGAMDIAFIGGTVYVLVTLVGPDVGGDDVVGIYRVDGPGSFTVIADIGRVRDGPSAEHVRSLCRPAFSTRSKPIVAGSWSRMAITTGCCTSHAMAR